MTVSSVPVSLESDWDAFCSLETDISRAESSGLEARHQFGSMLLRYPKGGGRGGSALRSAIRKLSAEFGISEAEIYNRRQFAEQYPEVSTAVETFSSWTEARDSLGKRAMLSVLEPVATPAGTFATIVADPPWQYDNKATRGAAEDHYPTMSLKQLEEIPVAEWSADQAHLYLWTTNGFLREAFDIVEAWGFTYKTTLVWVKPQIGMGNYFRSSAEYVLFGVKGSLRTRDRTLRNWFEAPRGRHSAKPDCFFEIVERASFSPGLEMFARRRRDNLLSDFHWDYWGNEEGLAA